MADFNPTQFNPIPPQFRLADEYEQPYAATDAVADDAGEDNGFYSVPSKKKKSAQMVFNTSLSTWQCDAQGLSSWDVEDAQTSAEGRIRAELIAKIQDAEVRLEAAHRAASSASGKQKFLEVSAEVSLYKASAYQDRYYRDNFPKIYQEELCRVANSGDRISPGQLSLFFSYDQFDSRFFSDAIGLRLSSSFKMPGTGNIVSLGIYGHGWIFAQSHFEVDDDPATSTSGNAYLPLGLSGGIDLRFGNCIEETKICPSAGFNMGLDPFRVISGLVLFAWDSWEVGADLGLQIGPIELRGGIYPNGRSVLFNDNNASLNEGYSESEIEVDNPTLSALNPGLRIGGHFPVK